MKHFNDITAAFQDMNGDIELRFAIATLAKNDGWLDKAEMLDRINRQAYFALLFAQLEVEVNGLCETLIRAKQDHGDWHSRRAWDLLDARQDRLRNLPFLKRLALLTDRGGIVYKRVKELYDTRNRIAHGDLLAESLDVAEVAKDIQDIAEQLKGAL